MQRFENEMTKGEVERVCKTLRGVCGGGVDGGRGVLSGVGREDRCGRGVFSQGEWAFIKV